MTREEFLHKWHDLGDLPVGEEQEFVADLDALLAAERARCKAAVRALLGKEHHYHTGNAPGYWVGAAMDAIEALGPAKGEGKV